MNEPLPVLSIRNVSKTFPGQKVLDDVSFDIAPGTIHGLVGMNGSGKSTLIKILSGYHKPDPGAAATVSGRQLSFGVAASSRALGMRFVHQSGGIIPELTAAENLAIPIGFKTRPFRGIDWPSLRDDCSRRLAQLGVSINLDEPMSGMGPVDRAAVAIARALDVNLDTMTGNVRLLVLDEPTAAFSPTETSALHRIVRALATHGVATMYVTHHISELLDLVDAVSVLSNGRLRETETRSGLNQQRLIELITGGRFEDVLPPEHDAGKDAGAEIILSVDNLQSGALNGISLDIRRGEVLGIAGLVGSGRDELARALTGSIPSTGSVTFDGQTHKVSMKTAKHGRILRVPGNRQRGSFIPRFSLMENITIGSLRAFTRYGVLRNGTEAKSVEQWIIALDIRPPRPEALFTTLSGGNQQKAILARALSMEPRVLILDDPTSGVDISARRAIYDIVANRVRQGATVIVCSSDFEDFFALCSRVLVLRHGDIAVQLNGSDINESALLSAVLTEMDQ
jgi:ribose transport system ATP-binding protein